MDPDGSINWEAWGLIDHYRHRIQVKEYAYDPSIVMNFDEVRLSSLEGWDSGELTLRYSVVNESGFDVEACMVVEVTTTDYHSPYEDHVHLPESVKNNCMFVFEDGSTEFEFSFGERDYGQRTDALVHLQLLTEEGGNVMAEYNQLLLIKSH